MIMASLKPDTLTLEDVDRLKNAAVMEISTILNRFSAQTGLDVYDLEMERVIAYGGPSRYAINLEVRL